MLMKKWCKLKMSSKKVTIAPLDDGVTVHCGMANDVQASEQLTVGKKLKQMCTQSNYFVDMKGIFAQ